MTEHKMSQQEFIELQRSIAEGKIGDEAVFFCNANPDDHLHVRRLGPELSDVSRIGVLAHSFNGPTTIYLSRFEARMLAAKLLDLADELDGTEKLMFFPPEDVK